MSKVLVSEENLTNIANAIKENNSDNAPTLWEDIAYKEGYRIIPETITAETAFMKNEYD